MPLEYILRITQPRIYDFNRILKYKTRLEITNMHDHHIICTLDLERKKLTFSVLTQDFPGLSLINCKEYPGQIPNIVTRKTQHLLRNYAIDIPHGTERSLFQYLTQAHQDTIIVLQNSATMVYATFTKDKRG